MKRISPISCAVVFVLLSGSLHMFNPSTVGAQSSIRDNTQRISVDSIGKQGNGDSRGPSISSDGRFVAFDSEATNLVVGDTNKCCDVFVHDRTTGKTTRISVDSTGKQGNNASQRPSISLDGRFVAFESLATNLDGGDTNLVMDIFVHDRTTGKTTRFSISSAAQQGNDASQRPSISSDGRCVAFESAATNLVAGDTNKCVDIFIHDRVTGKTTRVNVDSQGKQGDSGSLLASIAWVSGTVAFESAATNLVAGDTNGASDVFTHDRESRKTTRVSVDSSGKQGNDHSLNPSVSSDGRFVAFESAATNLVNGDTNGKPDVFVHDRATGSTTRVSVDSAGTQGNNSSDCPSISSDGRFVAFESDAINLIAGDTNGQRDVFVHACALLKGSHSAEPGGSARLVLAATNDVGLPYQLGSSLGTGPIPIGNRELGLNADDLLLVSVNLWWPSVFSGYRGVIDKNGEAEATIKIPNIRALIGQKIHTAFVTLQGKSPFGMKSISNTHPVEIKER